MDFARPQAVSLKEIIEKSTDDQEILKVKEQYHSVWNDNAKLYKIFQSELCFHEGLLLRGTRTVIPSARNCIDENKASNKSLKA